MTERRTTKMNAMEISHDNIDYEPRIRRPLMRQYPPLKTTVVAALLFIGGLFFLCFGISIIFSRIMEHGKDRGLAMVILGGISKFYLSHQSDMIHLLILIDTVFIPGSYASLIIYGTWKGWSGYDYSMIPSYDD